MALPTPDFAHFAKKAVPSSPEVPPGWWPAAFVPFIFIAMHVLVFKHKILSKII
jgi:hypothetical protein